MDSWDWNIISRNLDRYTSLTLHYLDIWMINARNVAVTVTNGEDEKEYKVKLKQGYNKIEIGYTSNNGLIHVFVPLCGRRLFGK